MFFRGDFADVSAFKETTGGHAQEARNDNNTPLLQVKIQEYDDQLEVYIPVLMAQAHIYWELGHYSQVMRVFNQSSDFASEHDAWKLNVAHTYFMMVRTSASIFKIILNVCWDTLIQTFF